MDPTTADIACNKGGESGAGLVATAEAGSKVTFQWTNVRTISFPVRVTEAPRAPC